MLLSLNKSFNQFINVINSSSCLYFRKCVFISLNFFHTNMNTSLILSDSPCTASDLLLKQLFLTQQFTSLLVLCMQVRVSLPDEIFHPFVLFDEFT